MLRSTAQPTPSIQSDSLKLVGLPRWQVWRMIHEVQLGRKCDTLRHQLEKEVALGANALTKADSLINAQKRQIELRDQAVEVQTERILNQQKANQELKQEVRKHKTRTLIVGGASLLLILIFL